MHTQDLIVAMFCTSCVLVQEAASLDPPLWYVLPTFYSYLYAGMSGRHSVGEERGSRELTAHATGER